MNSEVVTLTLDREAASEAGRALNAMRRIISSSCGVCGEEITGTVYRKWCSPRCAKRAERARDKAKKARVSQFLR